ncbi:hypothetical protein RI129_001857 [Pyrocoelia pectoralis]|uniref:Uncharacterized protein n=1 Tax=Pyrocoelia pectoralis TaxID=417401 RepID=A0AAN7ZXT3_9COLE
MGKNKTKQIKNVIKVVGSKQTKPKNKAKPVSGHIKRINFQNKSKVLEIDKQLLELHDRLQKGSTKTDTSQPSQKPKVDISKNVEDFINLQKASEETITELEDMQLH